jgi:predicted glutamine amidotransferase
MLERENMRDHWEENPDGAGYMFVHAGEVVIRKPFFKFKKLWKHYSRDFAQYGSKSPFVVHFRWATHGQLDAVNTHPHVLAGSTVGLVHNGVLPFTPEKSWGISDTVYFCRTVLASRSMKQLTDPKFGKTLEDIIGTANKLVLLDRNGRVSIVNESAGEWDADGCWYSVPAMSRGYRSYVLSKWRKDDADYAALTHESVQSTDTDDSDEEAALDAAIERDVKDWDKLSEDEWQRAVEAEQRLFRRAEREAQMAATDEEMMKEVMYGQRD